MSASGSVSRPPADPPVFGQISLVSYVIRLFPVVKRLVAQSMYIRLAAGCDTPVGVLCAECGRRAATTLQLEHPEDCMVGECTRILRGIDDCLARGPERVFAPQPFGQYGEPWRVHRPSDPAERSVIDSNGYAMVVPQGSDLLENLELLYLERIAACVNFCAGLPTEKLIGPHEAAAAIDRLSREANEVGQ